MAVHPRTNVDNKSIAEAGMKLIGYADLVGGIRGMSEPTYGESEKFRELMKRYNLTLDEMDGYIGLFIGNLMNDLAMSGISIIGETWILAFLDPEYIKNMKEGKFRYRNNLKDNIEKCIGLIENVDIERIIKRMKKCNTVIPFRLDDNEILARGGPIKAKFNVYRPFTVINEKTGDPETEFKLVIKKSRMVRSSLIPTVFSGKFKSEDNIIGNCNAADKIKNKVKIKFTRYSVSRTMRGLKEIFDIEEIEDSVKTKCIYTDEETKMKRYRIVGFKKNTHYYDSYGKYFDQARKEGNFNSEYVRSLILNEITDAWNDKYNNKARYDRYFKQNW